MNRSTDIPDVPTAVQKMLPQARIVSITVPDARAMNEDQLRDQAHIAYRQLSEKVQASGLPNILRIWNFIPDLLATTRPGCNRYMAFNEGRYAGMREWFRGAHQLENLAPAASGVGTASDDLSIHALVAADAYQTVQNPMQTPAVQYSSRFGPRPPCFARATRTLNLLLVSGTAAITGEESVPGDADHQIEVTLNNLVQLLKHARVKGDLHAFRQLRVYYPHMSDLAVIQHRCTREFAGVPQIEYLNVDLCRPELRVEIEGVATEVNPQ